jgi:hypothetical protein
VPAPPGHRCDQTGLPVRPQGATFTGQPAGCSRYTAVTRNKPLDFERGRPFFRVIILHAVTRNHRQPAGRPAMHMPLAVLSQQEARKARAQRKLDMNRDRGSPVWLRGGGESGCQCGGSGRGASGGRRGGGDWGAVGARGRGGSAEGGLSGGVQSGWQRWGSAALRQAGAEQLARNAARDHPSHSGVQERSEELLRKMAE